jgi:serine/threonine protein kinase
MTPAATANASMTVPAGTRLGSYEIVSPLGAGGMGEVYRARDTRLNRDVALKVLPDAFTRDPDRLARFKREAQVLASLSHPNIAAIYGFEESGGVQALVLELVEGPTLADRLSQGPIPLDEALPIARQIAEAVESAHEHGIVHRDLKPANVKVRLDGAVKVLDFGLAKALEPRSVSGADATASPTITSPAMTGMGVILGTAAYMSPEQAKGRAADRRSDVWAFGCVLYEMLTGRRAFEGEDISDTLASVLRGEPDWTALPAGVPRSIRLLLRGCLIKDRRHRVADLSAALFVLDNHADLSAATDPSPRTTLPPPQVPVWRKAIPVAMVMIVAITAAYGGWRLKREAAPPVTRFEMALGAGNEVTGPFAWSPDGRLLAYALHGRLYLRSFDQLDATHVAGGDSPPLSSPRSPFFSADGQWLGFWESGQLKKVSVSGGAPVVLGPVRPPPSGVTWTADNTIFFGHGAEGIWRLSGNGGTPERLIALEPGQRAHRPQLLPDGRTLLFTIATTANWDEAQIVVQSLEDETRHTLVTGTDGRYLSTGHLVYAFGNRVLAVPFDPHSRTIRGGPVTAIESVHRIGQYAAFAASSSAATLAYYPSATTSAARRTLVWVNREGREETIPVPARPYREPRVSPDGTRVAVAFPDDKGNTDVWVWDLAGRTWTRVTVDANIDSEPIWTPDGQRVLFTSRRTGEIGLFSQAANGTGTAERLLQLDRQNVALPAISPDGKQVLLRYVESGSSYVLIADLETAQHRGQTPPGPRGNARPLLKTEFEEYNAEISPDGRWLAYQSNSSGAFEVYVQPFPDVESGRWTVSAAGGAEPVWSRDGRELFYRAPDGAVMHVSISPGTTWKASAPTQLFATTSHAASGAGIFRSALSRTYDISPDGQRFLMLKSEETPAQVSRAPRLVIVQNWFRELERLAIPNP